MAKTEQKQVVVNEIKKNLEGASSVVLVSARGLTVEQDTQLRKTLRESGVTYKVYKNTMINFAVEGTEFESLKPYLEGPTAMAISYDSPVSAAKGLNQVAEKNEALQFKAGVVEGQLYEADMLKQIAAIPEREELLARLFGSFKSPIASFARVVKQIAEKNA